MTNVIVKCNSSQTHRLQYSVVGDTKLQKQTVTAVNTGRIVKNWMTQIIAHHPAAVHECGMDTDQATMDCISLPNVRTGQHYWFSTFCPGSYRKLIDSSPSTESWAMCASMHGLLAHSEVKMTRISQP